VISCRSKQPAIVNWALMTFWISPCRGAFHLMAGLAVTCARTCRGPLLKACQFLPRRSILCIDAADALPRSERKDRGTCDGAGDLEAPEPFTGPRRPGAMAVAAEILGPLPECTEADKSFAPWPRPASAGGGHSWECRGDLVWFRRCAVEVSVFCFPSSFLLAVAGWGFELDLFQSDRANRHLCCRR